MKFKEKRTKVYNDKFEKVVLKSRWMVVTQDSLEKGEAAGT
jgi:hypothetical protein